MTDSRVKTLRSPADPATLIVAADLSGKTNGSWVDGTANPISVPDGMKRLMIEWDLVFASAPTDFKGCLLYIRWNQRPLGQTARFATGTGSSYQPIGAPISLAARADTNVHRDSTMIDVEGTSFVVSLLNNSGVAIATGTDSIVRYAFETDVLTDAALP